MPALHMPASSTDKEGWEGRKRLILGGLGRQGGAIPPCTLCAYGVSDTEWVLSKYLFN